MVGRRGTCSECEYPARPVAQLEFTSKQPAAHEKRIGKMEGFPGRGVRMILGAIVASLASAGIGELLAAFGISGRDYLTDIILSVIFLTVFAVGIVLLYRFGCVRQAKTILLHLVTEAEKKWGGGTGEIKFSAVAEALYEKLPSAARFLLSGKTIASLIESAVEKMKQYLSQENGTEKGKESGE